MARRGLRAATRKTTTTWRAVPYNIRRLLAVSALFNAGVYLYSGLIPALLRASGVDVVRIGYFHSLSTAAGFVASLVGGVLADRVGRKPLIIASNLLYAVGTAAFSAAHDWPALVVVAVLWGCGALDRASRSAIVADGTRLGNRAKAFALLSAATYAAGVVAPLVGGLVAMRWGKVSLLTLAALLIAASAWTARSLRPRPRRPATGAAPRTVRLAARPLGLWRAVLPPAAGGPRVVIFMWLVAGVELGLTRPIIALYLQDRFGAGYAAIALTATLQSAATTVAILLGGFLAD
ncbi:MAG: MFS transporter, partial [Bacillota bacterium]